MKREEMQKPMTELKKRQELFCQEYVVDYNGTQAAVRARSEERR